MAWEYSSKTQQLFMDAVQGKPGTHLGEVSDPDGLGEHGSIACGDALRFTFKVKKDPKDPTKDIITEARYLTFGCTSAIASSEALCRLIEEGGYTPITALKIKNENIVKYLEGLPKQKIHCSVMGAEALEAAVFNWAQKRGVDLKALGVELKSEDSEEGEILCQCFSLSEPFIRRKIKEMGLKTIPAVIEAIKAGGACMSCHHQPGGLQDILDEIWDQNTALGEEEAPKAQEKPDAAASPYKFAKLVEKSMDDYIRPMLQKDGGDIEIVDIKNNAVYCELKGACSNCPGSAQTLKLTVESILKDRVDENIRVIQV